MVSIRKIKVLAKASSGSTLLLHIFQENKNFRSWKTPIVSCIKSVKTWIKEHNSDGVLATVPKMTSLAADSIQIFRAGVLTHSLRSMRRNAGLPPTPRRGANPAPLLLWDQPPLSDWAICMEVQSIALTWYSGEISNALSEGEGTIRSRTFTSRVPSLHGQPSVCVGKFTVIAKAVAPPMTIFPEKAAECLACDS